MDANDVLAHKYLRILAERPGQRVAYADIDRALGLTWNQRAGVQGALGRTIRRRSRVLPWETDYSARTVTMTQLVAVLFIKALGNRGR